MPPTQDLESRLETRIARYELHAVKDYVLKRAEEVLCLAPGEPSQAAEASPTGGTSRAGGNPELPPDTPWPTVDGHPMVFVAQLNMAEIAPFDPYAMLPKTGVLLFFFGNDEPSTHMPHKVLYVEDPTTLALITPSAPPLYTRTRPHLFGTDAQNPSPFQTCGLVPKKGLNIPPLPYAEEALDDIADKINDDEQAETLPEMYDLLARDIDGSWICKIYGYPEEHNGDLEYEAALRIHADKPYDCFKDSALETLTEHFAGDEARAQKAVHDAVLLLEVRSDCHTGFMWGNNGVIHYFIDRDDLLNRRFDNTFCSLTYV